MTITLHLHDGRSARCRLPYEGAGHVVADGLRCECSPKEALIVSGGAPREEPDGTTTAHAGCSRCRGSVGRLVVEFESLFGPEEDRAVLYGRPRVY